MPTMPTKRTDLTREKLLSAAFCEIHRHGFQAASIANILQDTGLTKGALYHHFPNKRDLGLAVIDEIIRDKLDGMIFRRIYESPEPVLALLQVISDIGNRRDPAFVELGCPLNNLMQEMSPLDHEFKQRLNGVLGTFGRVVEDALLGGQKAGVLRADIDCRAAALFIVSAWEGCVGVAKSLQSMESFSICMNQLHAYVRGLLAAPPA
jgi:TetR/AcrR family transcriptional regulator, transcriptional repressor for nem operon